MGHSMGTLDFFLLEAGEYLERLDALVQAPAGPVGPGEDTLRIVRAFRGSAIMASQHGMARAAQGLESVARALREGRLTWTEAVRGEVIRAVDDCKVLMHRLRGPAAGDTELAESIGSRLDRLSGRASAELRAAHGPGLDAGARAFVGREAAAVASQLAEVARALRAEPGARAPLATIGPAMSALRGVAVLNDLPPLGDILAAVDGIVKEVAAARSAFPSEAPGAFDDAAQALARAAREVVGTGQPDEGSAEAQAFAARVLRLLADGGTVVPIESLYFDDGGPHVVTPGHAPAPQPLARVDMVSQGEYLMAAAAELARADGPVQRDLRLFGIAANLRSLVAAGGAPLADAIGRFALAVRDAVGNGTAGASLERFTALVRAAAGTLADAQQGAEPSLAASLAATVEAVRALEAAPPAPVPAVAAAPVAPPLPAVPAPALAAAAAAVAVEPTPAPPVRAAGPQALWPGEEGTDLAAAYLTFARLVAERGLPPGSVAELVGAALPAAAAAEPPVVPIESLAPEEELVVPVEDLFYRGEAALHRIRELRRELVAAARTPADPRLTDLLAEVFDLVELGLTPAR